MKQTKLFLPCFVLFVMNLISYKVKKICRMAWFSSLLTRKDLMLILVNDVVFFAGTMWVEEYHAFVQEKLIFVAKVHLFVWEHEPLDTEWDFHGI